MNFPLSFCLSCTLTFSVLSFPAYSAEKGFIPEDFTAQHPLVPVDATQPFQEGRLYRLVLPPNVLLDLQREDQGDLCIFNADDVPVLRGFADTANDRRTVPGSITTLYPLWGTTDEEASSIRPPVDVSIDEARLLASPSARPDGKILMGYIAALPATGLPLEKLSFIWDKGNSDTVRFSVQSGNDLVNWRTLSDGETLVRFDGPEGSLENSTITLRTRRVDRYIRLLFEPGRAPEAIRQIDTLSHASGDSLLSFNTSPSPVSGPDQPAIVEYRLGDGSLPGGLPLVALDLALPKPGQYARVRVLTRFGDQGAWLDQGTVTLFSLLRQDTLVRNQPIPLRGSIANRIRLERVDGTPFTEAPVLTVRYRPVELYFLAQGNPAYTLAWGGRRPVTGVSSDIEDLRRMSEPETNEVILDPEIPLHIQRIKASDTPPAEAPPVTNWETILLWGALVFGTMLLAAMAWRLFRGMREKQ